jgi:hypothetical protein
VAAEAEAVRRAKAARERAKAAVSRRGTMVPPSIWVGRVYTAPTHRIVTAFLGLCAGLLSIYP